MDTQVPAGLPPQVQDAVNAQLPAVLDRLGASGHPPGALDVQTQEKASGVIVVTVTHEHTPTTATFELHPHTHGDQVQYTCDEVDYSSSDY